MEPKKSMSQKLRMDGRDYSRPGWYFLTLGADHRRHFCARDREHRSAGVLEVRGKGLGEVVNMFKGSVTRKWRQAHPEVSRHGGKERVWAPNYYDVICFGAEELETKERYIRANPRRWALKGVPQGTIKRSRYKGNKKLLRQHPRIALRVSRKTSETEVAALQQELAAFGGVVCSTFFSPGERACLETLLGGTALIIWVLPMAMPKAIPNKWTNAFLENRALWLSAFPDDMEAATRESCEQANRWVERFCCLNQE